MPDMVDESVNESGENDKTRSAKEASDVEMQPEHRGHQIIPSNVFSRISLALKEEPGKRSPASADRAQLVEALNRAAELEKQNELDSEALALALTALRPQDTWPSFAAPILQALADGSRQGELSHPYLSHALLKVIC